MIAGEGIDVSSNNGVVSWQQWRNAIEFTEVKATEGTVFKDPAFASNWHSADELNLHRFAYHYGHPAQSPSDQAEFFTDTVREEGLFKGDNFVLDLEANDGMSASDVSFWGYVFCQEMNRLNPGHRIVVQTYPDFASMGYCAKLGAWHLWIMEWDVPRPSMPVGPWKDYALWQWASGKVDRDRFNGTLAQLQTFCETTGPKGP
jgi:lysozyme